MTQSSLPKTCHSELVRLGKQSEARFSIERFLLDESSVSAGTT